MSTWYAPSPQLLYTPWPHILGFCRFLLRTPFKRRKIILSERLEDTFILVSNEIQPTAHSETICGEIKDQWNEGIITVSCPDYQNGQPSRGRYVRIQRKALAFVKWRSLAVHQGNGDMIHQEKMLTVRRTVVTVKATNALLPMVFAG